ncbi:hypothetical protein P167DRAFT_143900 [Morchella conica CCBAS932]|uniref:Uncharacterized protein n=1 Tax=Morchella conica CCBAS932 TaxID=1392247 RepID=A0A3N4KL20_9PEZI|nr:hypothetical protein P167DRAFT_143900 [Morchella conica CCBAS932]
MVQVSMHKRVGICPVSQTLKPGCGTIAILQITSLKSLIATAQVTQSATSHQPPTPAPNPLRPHSTQYPTHPLSKPSSPPGPHAQTCTLPDQKFKTLDYTARILQTHQPYPTTTCPLLAEISNPNTPDTRSTALYGLVHDALHVFSAAGGRPRNSIPQPRASRTPRSATVTSNCRVRDGNKSILSTNRFIEVTHIIPHPAEAHPGR